MRARILLPLAAILFAVPPLGLGQADSAVVTAGGGQAYADADVDTSLLVGATVSITLRSGRVIELVQVTEVQQGKSPEAIVGLRVKAENRRSTQRLRASAIERIVVEGRRFDVVEDDVSKAYVLIDLQQRQEEVASRLAARNEQLWEEETPEGQVAAVLEHKAFLEKVRNAFGNHPMTLHETEYFLFLTDMPDQQVGGYIAKLDAMNEQLGEAFHVADGTNIWRGKCVVVCFIQHEMFKRFEDVFFMNASVADNVYALCHSFRNGNVVIGCHRGDDPVLFAHVLVHETSHGYLHRYRSSTQIPSWINEGIAEWIGAAVVPDARNVAQRQRDSVNRLRQTGTLGGAFFENRNIEAWQYGLASSMTDFMLKSDPIAFRRMIDGIKEGHSWEESLQQAYGVTPAGLAEVYGRRIGVPNLAL